MGKKVRQKNEMLKRNTKKKNIRFDRETDVIVSNIKADTELSS